MDVWPDRDDEGAAPPWWMALVIAALAIIACGVLSIAAILGWVVWGIAA